jgi:hypothetical protein
VCSLSWRPFSKLPVFRDLEVFYNEQLRENVEKAMEVRAVAKYPINGEENTRSGRWIFAGVAKSEGKLYAGSVQIPGVVGVTDSDIPDDAVIDFGRKARQYVRDGGQILPPADYGENYPVDLEEED